MFAYSDVQHFVLSTFFTFWAPCCDARYDFRIKTMAFKYVTWHGLKVSCRYGRS